MKAVTSNMMTKASLFSGLFLSLGLAVGVAQAALTGSGKLEFHAKGPMGLKIDGTGPLTVAEDGGLLKFTSPFAKLDTGMDMRNKHMRERMHADKHPNVTFQVERSKLKFPTDGQSVEGKAEGSIQLNGVTKPAAFTYKAARAGATYTVSGDLGVNVTNHGIKEDDLCEMGVCAKPDVKVHVTFKVNE
jgi:polyisoprenoid-binding protein YceI